jgi:hypothetical protein
MYRIKASGRYEGTGHIKHETVIRGNDEVFKYYAVRVGMVWPSIHVQAYIVGVGEEVFDRQLYADSRGVLRVFYEQEFDGLNFDALFRQLSDIAVSSMAEVIYVDLDQEDYKTALYEFFDKQNLRNLSVQDIPFKDVLFRFGIVDKWNSSGNLIMSPDGGCFQEVKAISRADMVDEAVTDKFFRLNALSFAISGFDKFPPDDPLLAPSSMRSPRDHGWMEF